MERIELSKLKWTDWLAALFGFLMCCIGILVIFGWYAHKLILIQILPNMIAMQFNTALCVTLSGLALLFLGLGSHFLSRLFSFLAGLLAFIICTQYLFGVNLGIDQLFFTYNLDYPIKYPGRMAFNTSVAFTLGNLSTFLLNDKENEISPLLSLFLSILVISVGFTSLIGHLTGLETEFGWLDFSRMALHTMISFLLLGTSTFIYNVSRFAETKFSRISLPISIMVGVLASTIATWQVFRTQEFFTLAEFAKKDLGSVVNTIDEKLEEELLAIKRFVDRWQILKEYNPQLWTIDASNYLSDFAGLNTLTHYNKDLKAIQTISDETYLSIRNVENFTSEEIRKIKEGKTLFIPSKSKIYLFFFYPIMVNYEFNGLLGGGINLTEILNEEIKRLSLGNYLISLLYENQVIFSAGDTYTPSVGRTYHGKIKPEFGDWSISLTLTEAAILPNFYSWSIIILITGIVISLLGAILVYFGQNLKIQKISLELANKKLLQETQRAESANIAKGIFLATMSHEIKTPLNAIVGTSELLEQSELNPTQKKYADRIIHASNTLLELISGILDFSKIEAGGIKLDSVPTDLFAITKIIADNLAFKAKSKKIDILLDCPSQPIPKILSDPLRIQQIIANLGNNALKFTEKGFILIRFAIKNISEDVCIIRFEVVDTGIGISDADKPKLFQKFSQVEEATSRKYGGVGLGLSISKKLTEIMGGSIGFSSVYEKGSTFWAEIPFQRVATSPPPPYELSNSSILLIDELEKESEIIQKYLNDWGAQVDLTPTKQHYHFILSSSIDEAKRVGTGKIVLIANQLLNSVPEGVLGVVTRPIAPRELYKILSKGKEE